MKCSSLTIATNPPPPPTPHPAPPKREGKIKTWRKKNVNLVDMYCSFRCDFSCMHAHAHTHCCWSLLHGAILCSWADSLWFVMWLWMSDCSLSKHVFEYPLQWCIYSAVCYMAGATWNCCCLSTCSVDSIQPCTSLQCHSCYVPLTWPCLDHSFFHKDLAHSQNSKPYQFMVIVIIIKLKTSSACACSRQTLRSAPPPSIQGDRKRLRVPWSPCTEVLQLVRGAFCRGFSLLCFICGVWLCVVCSSLPVYSIESWASVRASECCDVVVMTVVVTKVDNKPRMKKKRGETGMAEHM